MRKTIMKIGDSYGIIFNREEMRNFNFKLDDIIELTKIKKIKVDRK